MANWCFVSAEIDIILLLPQRDSPTCDRNLLCHSNCIFFKGHLCLNQLSQLRNISWNWNGFAWHGKWSFEVILKNRFHAPGLWRIGTALLNFTSCLNLWFILEVGGDHPSTLHQVRLPVVSNADCNTRYSTTIYDSQICAGDTTTGGVDSCQVSWWYCHLVELSRKIPDIEK